MESPLRRIREELGLKQNAFALALGVPQQSLSRAEKSGKLSEYFERCVLEAVDKHFSDKKGQITSIIDSFGPLDEQTFLLDAQEEKEVEPPEGDAWSFALQFRNAMMLDRLACHSLAVGLVPIRMADGLLLTGQKAPTGTLRLDDLLYPCPRRVGLESGMVVLLGSPESHRAAAKVLKVFMAYLQANQWEVKIAIFPDKPDYFGYSVCLKSLRVRTKTYYPRRYVAGDTLAISYEDFGVIFSTGLRPEILQGKHPFGAGASQLILICGLHRLATGAGVKLLDDLDFRELVLKGTDFDFPSGDRMGVLAYRVVLRTDNRSWSGVEGFRWSNSTVQDFSVLASWNESIDKLRRPGRRVLANLKR